MLQVSRGQGGRSKVMGKCRWIAGLAALASYAGASNHSEALDDGMGTDDMMSSSGYRCLGIVTGNLGGPSCPLLRSPCFVSHGALVGRVVLVPAGPAAEKGK